MWRILVGALVLAIVVVVVLRRRAAAAAVRRSASAAATHAVLVRFENEGTDLGPIHELEDRLETAIDAAGAGEFDGNEVGGGECTLYLYGRDADRLFAAVEPVLRADPLTAKARIVMRYGPATDPAARKVTVDLGAP